MWVTSYGGVSFSWLRLTGRCSDKSFVEVYMLSDCEGVTMGFMYLRAERSVA